MVTIVSLAIYCTCLTLAMLRNAIKRKASKVLIILWKLSWTKKSIYNMVHILSSPVFQNRFET